MAQYLEKETENEIAQLGYIMRMHVTVVAGLRGHVRNADNSHFGAFQPEIYINHL
jgi:hypothetical protein